MKKYFWLIAGLLSISHTIKAQYEDRLHVKLNGFGDMVLGETFGGNANQQSADLFKKYGDDQFPTGMHKGLNMHGFDITGSATMKKNFKFLTELNLEGYRGADGGAMEMEIERMNLDYSLSDKLGFRVGLIYTP